MTDANSISDRDSRRLQWLIVRGKSLEEIVRDSGWGEGLDYCTRWNLVVDFPGDFKEEVPTGQIQGRGIRLRRA